MACKSERDTPRAVSSRTAPAFDDRSNHLSGCLATSPSAVAAEALNSYDVPAIAQIARYSANHEPNLKP